MEGLYPFARLFNEGRKRKREREKETRGERKIISTRILPSLTLAIFSFYSALIPLRIPNANPITFYPLFLRESRPLLCWPRDFKIRASYVSPSTTTRPESITRSSLRIYIYVYIHPRRKRAENRDSCSALRPWIDRYHDIPSNVQRIYLDILRKRFAIFSILSTVSFFLSAMR